MPNCEATGRAATPMRWWATKQSSYNCCYPGVPNCTCQWGWVLLGLGWGAIGGYTPMRSRATEQSSLISNVTLVSNISHTNRRILVKINSFGVQLTISVLSLVSCVYLVGVNFGHLLRGVVIKPLGAKNWSCYSCSKCYQFPFRL